MAIFLVALSSSNITGQAKADDGDYCTENQEWWPVVAFNLVGTAGNWQGHEGADDGSRLNPLAIDTHVPTGGCGNSRHESRLAMMDVDRSLDTRWRCLLDLQWGLLKGLQTIIEGPLLQAIDANVLQPGTGLLETEGDRHWFALLVVGQVDHHGVPVGIVLTEVPTV